MGEWSESVLPHGQIEEIGKGFWQVTGSLKRNPLPRNMVFWKAPDGSVIVHSVVCLDDESMAAIEALGPVRHILVPCRMHRTDAPRFKARYPDARILCPSFAREKVEEVVPVDGTFEEVLPDLGVELFTPVGIKPFEFHLGVPLEGGTYALVVTDALFNLGPKPPRGFGGWTVKMMGSVGPLGITRAGRFLLLDDKSAYQTYLEGLAAARPWSVLSVAHGVPVVEDVAPALMEAAARV
jgi:hypothetical protein